MMASMRRSDADGAQFFQRFAVSALGPTEFAVPRSVSIRLRRPRATSHPALATNGGSSPNFAARRSQCKLAKKTDFAVNSALAPSGPTIDLAEPHCVVTSILRSTSLAKTGAINSRAANADK